MDTDDNDYNVTFYLPCGLIDDDVQLPLRRHRRLTSSNGADSESSAAQVRLFSSYCSTQAHPNTSHTSQMQMDTDHRDDAAGDHMDLDAPSPTDAQVSIPVLLTRPHVYTPSSD